MSLVTPCGAVFVGTGGYYKHVQNCTSCTPVGPRRPRVRQD